jgi:hypothetical protein
MTLTLAIVVIWLTFTSSLKDWIKTLFPNSTDQKFNFYFVLILLAVAILATWQLYEQEKDKTKDNKSLIDDFTNSLDTAKLSSAVNEMSVSIERIKYLSIALNDSLSIMVRAKDSLLTQYIEVKNRLKKQIEIEQQLIDERAPILDLSSSDVQWISLDSMRSYLRICISNTGGRPKKIISGKYAMFFVDKDSKPFFSLNIPKIESPYIVPIKSTQIGACNFSDIITIFPKIKSLTKFAFIYIQLKTKDPLEEKINNEEFFITWNPIIGFGGTLDADKSSVKKYLTVYGEKTGLLP